MDTIEQPTRTFEHSTLGTVTVETAVKFRENAVTAVVRDADGITVYVRGIGDAIRLTFASLSAKVRDEAMGYGMEVRLTRAAALERDSKTKKSASAQDKFDAIKRLADHYASGTEAWAMSGGAGGGLNADTTALIEALSAAFGIDRDVAEEQVRDMSQADRAQLRVHAEVKPHLDAVYAGRARASGADVAAMIARLKAVGVKM